MIVIVRVHWKRQVSRAVGKGAGGGEQLVLPQPCIHLSPRRTATAEGNQGRDILSSPHYVFLPSRPPIVGWDNGVRQDENAEENVQAEGRNNNKQANKRGQGKEASKQKYKKAEEKKNTDLIEFAK